MLHIAMWRPLPGVCLFAAEHLTRLFFEMQQHCVYFIKLNILLCCLWGCCCCCWCLQLSVVSESLIDAKELHVLNIGYNQLQVRRKTKKRSNMSTHMNCTGEAPKLSMLIRITSPTIALLVLHDGF
jgi:hypothetical protein